MNLLDLAVKLRVDDQASGEIEGISAGIKSSLGGAAAKAGAVMAAVAAAAVTGGVAIGNAALNAYGSYEQLVGGVDTLFKESSKLVQQYADNAYKTSGLSANAYMETVTGFSASLLQSLGGDTKKAADYGDMAIRDMSDNANKMGTAMESIQYAYQGFAKQNYTMLDNLKLGYGGTKAEMERLLADAEKISGIHYDISSFGDIVAAIHVIQGEIGITGTTAAEAAGTLEGSAASMKAAWDNWLVSVAKGNGDIAESTDALVETITASLSNTIPRIIEIAKGLGTALIQELPNAFMEISKSIVSVLPESAQTAISDIVAKVSSLKDALQPFADFVGGTLTTAFETFMPLLEGLAEPLLNVAESILPALLDVASAFLPVLEDIVEAAFGIADEVVPLILEAVDKFAPVFQTIIDTIVQAAEVIAPYVEALISIVVPILSDIVSMIVSTASAILEAVMPAVEAILGFVQTALPFIGEIFSGHAEMLQTLVSGAWTFIKSIVEGVLAAVQFNIEFVLGIIQGIMTAATQIMNGDWAGAWETIKTTLSNAWESMKEAVNSGIETVKSLVEGLPGAILDIFSNVGTLLFDAGKSIISGLWDGLTSKWEEVKSWFSSITASIPDLKGPENVDKKLLENAGYLTVGGYLKAMQSAWVDVEKFFAVKTADVATAFDGVSFGLPDYAAEGGNSAPSNGAKKVYTFGDIYIESDDLAHVESIEDFIEVIMRAKRSNPTRGRG